MRRKSRLIGGLIIFFILISACGKKKMPIENEEEVLLSVNGENLTLNDVVNRIPVGIESEDSIALFEDIVDTWVSERVLAQMAESKIPNMEEIERRVSSFRNRLIVREYLRQMREGREIKVSDDSVRHFYELHKNEMLTEVPLVKGIYMKVSSSSEKLDEIRHHITNASEESIDRLENHYGREALQYDYFANVWVDWQTIADLIPYRFYDPDAFLQSTRDFETSYNGSTYLLHITDYLPSGSVPPFEYAQGKIQAIMEQIKISSYEDLLVESLVKKALKEGTLVRKGYDPITRKMISQHSKENKK